MKLYQILIIVALVIAGAAVVAYFASSRKKPAEKNVDVQKQPQQSSSAGNATADSLQIADDKKQKGNSFEGYVADILKGAGITLKKWNQGSTSPGGAYAENELEPDFYVRHVSGGKDLEYWVECKFRSYVPKEGFTLEQYQLDRYRSIQGSSKRKILVALGLGGDPSKPDRFFLIPLDSIARFKRIPEFYLKGYQLERPESEFGTHVINWFVNEVFAKKRKEK